MKTQKRAEDKDSFSGRNTLYVEIEK